MHLGRTPPITVSLDLRGAVGEIAFLGESLSIIAMSDTSQSPRLLMHCGQVRPERGWGMPLHVHESFHELILVLSGQIVTKIAGRTLVGAKGEVLFYPARRAHEERSGGATPLATIFMSIRDDGTDTSSWPLMAPDRMGRMEFLFRWAWELFPPHGDLERQMLDGLARAVAFEYAGSGKATEAALAQAVRQYVRAHLAERICLDDLAASAHLSRFHFCRIFRQATGRTPMRFATELRVEEARSLLLRTEMPIKAIARQTGFADEYHFSRVFRRIAGLPPGAARRARGGPGF